MHAVIVNPKRLFFKTQVLENNQFGQFPDADFKFSDKKKRKYPFSSQKIILENICLKRQIPDDPIVFAKALRQASERF